jgi:hypothetical protein
MVRILRNTPQPKYGEYSKKPEEFIYTEQPPDPVILKVNCKRKARRVQNLRACHTGCPLCVACAHDRACTSCGVYGCVIHIHHTHL